jgi:predicted ATPase
LTLAALLDQLEALAREKPVLMLFEDVHWADASSLEVLELTVERVRALPVLALFTFRPEYDAPGPASRRSPASRSTAWHLPRSRPWPSASPPGRCRSQ